MSLSDQLFHGLFNLHTTGEGVAHLRPADASPRTIPCPTTGRPLKVSTVDADAHAICPKCSWQGHGGFVSFVADLRMAYACPGCLELVWLAGL